MREIIVQLTDEDYAKVIAETDYNCDLVRCENCKWGSPEKNAKGEDMIACANSDSHVDINMLLPPGWYCADGEWREEGS